MALIFVDGFDFWTTPPGCWTSETGSPTVSGSKVTISGAPWTVGSNLRWTFPSSPQTVIVNIRAAFTPKTFDEPFVVLMTGNTEQCTVTLNSAGQLAVKRGGPSGTQVGVNSSGGLVMDGITYYDIEMKFVVANAGSCIIQLNGDEILNVSGDLAADTAEVCDNIKIGFTAYANGSSNSSNSFYLDHVVIMDTTGTAMNDFIGPIKVNPHYLTADGFYTDFTANVGARWDAVNDLDPDDGTTYITANAVGNKYTAVADNLPAGITNVYALAVWARSQRSDDVTRAYKALLRYSGTDQLGTDHKYIGPNYAYQISTFDVSPFSATTWTPTEIDGLEVGVQITV